MPPQSILPPLKSRPKTQNGQTPPLVAISELLHTNFSPTTWLLLGALLQSILSLVTNNTHYALLSVTTLLLLRILDALLIHLNLKRNPYLSKAIIRKRTTAVVPDEEGKLVAPGSQRVVIMLLGAKTNHPFGVLAPQFLSTFRWMKEINEFFDRDEGGPEGFLGQTNWQRKDERGAMEFVFISYWRSIEQLHAFAHGPLHRQAWLWWEKTIRAHDCVGINHEVYEADPGHWENMYANFQPTGLGATTYLRRGDGKEGGLMEGGKVPEEWISPLVDASKGKWKAASGRLGIEETRWDRDRPDADVYG